MKEKIETLLFKEATYTLLFKWCFEDSRGEVLHKSISGRSLRVSVVDDYPPEEMYEDDKERYVLSRKSRYVSENVIFILIYIIPF